MYDGIAMNRYMETPALKGKLFMFQHVWKLLGCSQKWRLRDQEAPPKRSFLHIG
jgi:hypothetical protein